METLDEIPCPACAGRGLIDTAPWKERLKAKTTVTSKGCWEYGTSKRPYPTIFVGVLRLAVHRLSVLLVQGVIPPEALVLHECDNPICWNPEHLLVGSVDRNNKDRRERYLTYGRSGAKNHFAKLTMEQVVVIRASGDSRGMLTRKVASQLAENFGVSRNTVYRAFTGHTWREDTRKMPEPRPHWSKR